ncbi:hypothetical protein INT45_002033 [Circinella minor]|uniref:Uncharacterized protein n=1 Tax=Circinella minor TaxID=1195481 RepID=A0A8H7VP30_9FUNG|nr:hypothetical protein INT45_002033 [Circinella minor]
MVHVVKKPTDRCAYLHFESNADAGKFLNAYQGDQLFGFLRVTVAPAQYLNGQSVQYEASTGSFPVESLPTSSSNQILPPPEPLLTSLKASNIPPSHPISTTSTTHEVPPPPHSSSTTSSTTDDVPPPPHSFLAASSITPEVPLHTSEYEDIDDDSIIIKHLYNNVARGLKRLPNDYVNLEKFYVC